MWGILYLASSGVKFAEASGEVIDIERISGPGAYIKNLGGEHLYLTASPWHHPLSGITLWIRPIGRHEAPSFGSFSIKNESLMPLSYWKLLSINTIEGDCQTTYHSSICMPSRSKLNSESSHSSDGISPAGLTIVPAAGIGRPSSSRPVPLLVNSCSKKGSHTPLII